MKILIDFHSTCKRFKMQKRILFLSLFYFSSILLFGQNKGNKIKDFGLKNYREFTAAVMQDDALLSGSILDNISFFAEEINLEEVYKVAKLSFIHDEIMKFPMGYETLVGDMGSTLSGGQKQRILLARALYKQPKILFLDEATSHLDITNEKNINNSLKLLNITQIVIAHRQETILMADRVIDLSKINY